jgi:hypothetical protein
VGIQAKGIQVQIGKPIMSIQTIGFYVPGRCLLGLVVLVVWVILSISWFWLVLPFPPDVLPDLFFGDLQAVVHETCHTYTYILSPTSQSPHLLYHRLPFGAFKVIL